MSGALVHLPFVAGQSETVDTKIAPFGVLKLLQNGRIDRQGRITKRLGYGLGIVTAEYSGSLAAFQALAARGDERVAIADDRVCAWLPTQARWRQWNYVPRVGVPRRYAGMRNSSGDALAPSVAVTGNYLCLIAESPLGAAKRIIATIYDRTTWTVRSVAMLTQTGERPRVVACGTTFVAIWRTSAGAANLEWSTFSTTSGTATWSAVQILTALAALGCRFDASPYNATSYLVAHENGAGGVRAVHYDTAGLTLGQNTQAFVGAPAICGADTEGASMAWCEAGGAVKVVSYAFSGGPLGGAITGPTTLATETDLVGHPLVCRKSATVHTVGWAINESSPANEGDATRFREVTRATHVLGTTLTRYYTRPVSKAAYISGRLYWLGVNLSTYDRTLYLLSHTSTSATSSNDETVETMLARSSATDFSAVAQYADLLTFTTSGVTEIATAFPFLQDGSVASADPFTAVDLAVIPFGGSERHQCAEVGGVLYMSGGLLTTFDGQTACELGWLAAPKIFALTGQAAAGGLTPSSTYSYVLTREWYDAQGGRWVSQVSDVATVVMGVGQNQVRVDFQYGSLSNRRLMWTESAPEPVPTPFERVHIWRTEANGTVFRRVTTDDGRDGFAGPASVSVFYSDTMSDATLIAGQPIVYTQGIRGGLSGPLQNDPPPPCRYIWPGKNRMIVGGLENPNEFRLSKFFFPNEPIGFSDDFSFRGRVPGEVTAVAYLDDTAIVFTAEAIYAVPGEGPDDSGVNPVGDPVRIPSECGCIDWRSLVETPLGLMFQGGPDRIYLLPRGGGAPVWIGQAVRDTLGSDATIVAAKLIPERSLVAFTFRRVSSLDAQLLVYDLTHNAWSADVINLGVNAVAGSTVWDGMLAHHVGSGYYVERATPYSDDGSWYGVAVETHALRPHGLQADGRTRKVGVIGEYRGITQMRVELAPDDSQTFPYSALINITAGPEVSGDALRREWRLPVQKFGSCRLKIGEVQFGSTISEGFRLTGLTIETQPRIGMPRLGATRRA